MKAPPTVAPRPKAPTPARSSAPAPKQNQPATPAPKQKQPPTPAHKQKQPANPVKPTLGGYAFADGHFQLSATGRAIVGFTARTACAGPLVLPPIEVSPARAFGFSGHPAGSLPGTTVRLTGRFASRSEARGTLRVTRKTCRDPATHFVAHLS